MNSICPMNFFRTTDTTDTTDTAIWKPGLSFQCCLRADGVIYKEDGVLPPRLKTPLQLS